MASTVIVGFGLLKPGKRLAYGEISLYTECAEDEGPVARVTATYSILPEREGT
jgi:acyl-coenzyme A thioesterase PaaI-like protein